MFNASSLLLDNALLKRVVTEVVLFLVVDISQGIVATYFRFVGILNDSIRPIKSCLLILTVTKFENWSIFDEVIRSKKVCLMFRVPCRKRK